MSAILLRDWIAANCVSVYLSWDTYVSQEETDFRETAAVKAARHNRTSRSS